MAGIACKVHALHTASHLEPFRSSPLIRSLLIPGASWKVGTLTSQRTSAVAATNAVTVASGALMSQGWPLWASVFSCAAVGHLAEEHTSVGRVLSAPLVSMLMAVALSATGLIPPDCPSYNVVWKYMMPMAASCFMLNTDVGRLVSTGGYTMASFLIGSIGMVTGAILGWWLLRNQLGPEGGKLAGALCSSYVGGSVNFCAIATAVNLDPIVIPAAMAADNLAMAAYLAVLMAIPVPPETAATSASPPPASVLQPAAPSTSASSAAITANSTDSVAHETAGPPGSAASSSTVEREPLVTSGSLVMCAAAASLSCSLAQALAALWHVPHLTLLLMTVITIALAGALRFLMTLGAEDKVGKGAALFAGAPAIGGGLMLVFFSIIGASAGSLSSLSLTGTLMGFMTIMVCVHWLFMVVGSLLFRLPRDAALVGSNACIGGPATATAMAQSRGWIKLVSPAMLSGSLGYGIGTAAGLLVVRVAAALAAGAAS